MKYIAIKTAQMRLMATLLLLGVTFSAHAQYYMNIRQNDGTRLRYAVSSVDSIWFDNGDDEHECVDLGLKVKWATCNVGAEKPEDYGDYFAWGDTTTYYKPGYAQENPQNHWKEEYIDSYYDEIYGYEWTSYKYNIGDYDNNFIKYSTEGMMGNLGYNGFLDNLTTLVPDDDVAHAKWGGDWRMPTIEDYYELVNNCDCEWTTQNGVNGLKVTSRKDSSLSIFLPAAGFRHDKNLEDFGSRGHYWLSSLETRFPMDGKSFEFFSNDVGGGGDLRCYGLSVRPVRP
jgi:hypothetical protein